MQKAKASLLVTAGLASGAVLVGAFADNLPPLIREILAWVGVVLLAVSATAWLVLESRQKTSSVFSDTSSPVGGTPTDYAGPFGKSQEKMLVPLHEAARELYGRFRKHNRKGWAVVAAERSARMFQRQDDAVLYYYGCWMKDEGGVYGKIYPSSELEEIDFREYEKFGALHVEETLSEFRYHGQRRSITDLHVERASIEKVFNKYKDWLEHESDKNQIL